MFFPLYFYCIQVLNSQIFFFRIAFACCAQQTLFLQLHDQSIVFSVNFDCEIMCFVKCRLHVVVYWEMSLCFVKCGAVLSLRAIILLGKRSSYFDMEKKKSGSKRRSRTHWKTEERHMISPSLQHVELDKGHAEGPGQIRDREGCVLCDTDQLFPWENLQEADKHAAIAQISVQVTNATGHSAQVRVYPFGKGLLLYSFTLICKGDNGHRGHRKCQTTLKKKKKWVLIRFIFLMSQISTISINQLFWSLKPFFRGLFYSHLGYTIKSPGSLPWQLSERFSVVRPNGVLRLLMCALLITLIMWAEVRMQDYTKRRDFLWAFFWPIYYWSSTKKRITIN